MDDQNKEQQPDQNKGQESAGPSPATHLTIEDQLAALTKRVEALEGAQEGEQATLRADFVRYKQQLHDAGIRTLES